MAAIGPLCPANVGVGHNVPTLGYWSDPDLVTRTEARGIVREAAKYRAGSEPQPEGNRLSGLPLWPRPCSEAFSAWLQSAAACTGVGE
jgi:hypothetical protein